MQVIKSLSGNYEVTFSEEDATIMTVKQKFE